MPVVSGDGGTGTEWKSDRIGIPTAEGGQIYSDMLSSPGLKTPTAGFDNNYSAGRSEGTGGLTFTPAVPISYSTSVQVYDNNNVTKSRVNNGPFVQHSGSTWVTIASGSGTINSMYFERSDNAAWDAGFYGIRVDGNQLVDSTAVADPSTASAGDIYYRTDTKKLRVYDGSSWSDV